MDDGVVPSEYSPVFACRARYGRHAVTRSSAIENFSGTESNRRLVTMCLTMSNDTFFRDDPCTDEMPMDVELTNKWRPCVMVELTAHGLCKAVV